MPKRIANGLTLLSAVVCVGSAMLVGRSLFQADEFFVPLGQEGGLWMGTLDGQLMLGSDPSTFNFEHLSFPAWEGRRELDDSWRELTGIRWIGIGWGKLRDRAFLILPLWLVPLLTAIPPVRWWRARRRNVTRGFAVERTAA